jgi:DNA-binding LacI/PurR family transcriptional regulator
MPASSCVLLFVAPTSPPTAQLRARRAFETPEIPTDERFAASWRILARADRPTAIFAFNDITAIAALSAADDLHLDVPADLSVVGYDNTYLSRIRHFSPTSIDNGNFAVGVQAAKFLLERLDNPRLPQRMYFFDPELHIRRSTQALLAT